MDHKAVILLVEDNHLDIKLTLDAFKHAKFENRIEVVRNGQDALAYLFGEDKYGDRKAFPLPDLVLLDLNLPRVDGREVLRRVKQTPGLRRLPIIVLTSSAEEGDRAVAYDCGVNSYLVKPIQFSGFIEVVQQIGTYWLSLNVRPPMEEEGRAKDEE